MVSLQAVFKGALLEDGDIISYTGPDFTYRGLYSVYAENRLGTKFPAESLQGHDSLLAVECLVHNRLVAVNVHIGGEDAPGPMIHSQQLIGPDLEFSWQRALLDSAIAIPPDSNMWIVIQPLESDIVYGALGVDCPDANWFSTDSGATWGHLSDYTPPYAHCNPSVSWFVRCITSSAVSVGIEEVALSNATITTTGLLLTVDNPDGKTVRIYDIMGRLMATSPFLPQESIWSKSTTDRQRKLLQSDNMTK